MANKKKKTIVPFRKCLSVTRYEQGWFTTNVSIYNIFFIHNKLIFSNQLGFKPGDSCINQLLCITYDIYLSFDSGFDTRAVFIDISKAFDKVWFESLPYKLKQSVISGNFVNNITDVLSLRKQRVVLNWQHSAWVNHEGVVPQWSLLGALFFVIWINDLLDDLTSNQKLFAGFKHWFK